MQHIQTYESKFTDGIKKIVKDYKDYFKEKGKPEFKLIDQVFDYLIEESSIFSKLQEEYTEIIKLVIEYKKEEKKEYSERKYEIADEIDKMWKSLQPRYAKAIDNFIVKYYEEFDQDITSDVDTCINYIKSSEWYKGTDYIVHLITLKNILDKSRISMTMRDLLG